MAQYFRSNGPAAIAPLPVEHPRWWYYLIKLHNSRSSWFVEPTLVEASTPNEKGWSDYLPVTSVLKNLEIVWHANDEVGDGLFWPPAGFLLPGRPIMVVLRQANSDRSWVVFSWTVVQRLHFEQTPTTVPVWRLICTGGQVRSVTDPELLERLYALFRGSH